MEPRQPIRQQLRQRRTLGDGTGSRVALVSGFGPLMMMSVIPKVTPASGGAVPMYDQRHFQVDFITSFDSLVACRG